MTGPELGKRVGAMRHRIRQLFTSGHFDAPQLLSDRGVAVLQKPRTPDMLARKVREVLGQANGDHGRSFG